MAGDNENLNPMVGLVSGVKRLAKKVDARYSAAVRYYNDPEKGNRRRQITGFPIFGLFVILVCLNGCPKNQQENSEPAVNKEPVKTETPNQNNNQKTPSEDGKKTKEKGLGENPPVVVEVYGKDRLPPLLYDFQNG